LSSTGAPAGQDRRDASAASDVTVVSSHAPVEAHPTVASRFYDDDLVSGALNLELLVDAILDGRCYK